MKMNAICQKITLTVFAVLCTATLFAASKPRTKVIDEGGSGPYKSIATEEKTFPDAVVYRPADLKAAVAAEGPLPVLVWANGGCNNTSLPHERLLGELASNGYIIIALGSMVDSIDERPLVKSPNEQMNAAMDWITAQNALKRSVYFNCADTDKIAVAGQSCGGAQALVAAADPRVKTCVMVNSGMGTMSMSGASPESLADLHSPILYMEGGVRDQAFANGRVDYASISHVFAAFANHLTSGHVGDYADIYGGSFERMLNKWLDWQLKGDAACGEVFLRNKLDEFPGWTMKCKEPGDGFVNEAFSDMEVHVTNAKGQNIWGKLYLPNDGAARHPLAILAHGYNSSYTETDEYAQLLAQQGIASYVFDFCGGGLRSRSEGTSIEMSVFTEADDIAAIVAAARSWSFIDKDRIALLGCSQGGLVAAISSSQIPWAFKSVVLVYPAFSIGVDAINRHPKEAITSETGVDVMGLPLSHVYYDKLIGYNVFDEMPKYQGDVMIVYGDKDPIAAGDYIERAQKCYRSCEVNVVEGGAHGFPESHTHVVAGTHIVDFLVKTLK